jgi:hypothetical protein
MMFVVAVLLLYCSQLTHAEEPWKLAKEGEGIKVFTRAVPGSAANEFKGIAEIEAPIEVIMEVFKDIPSYPRWYGFCRETKLIKEDTETHRIIYFYFVLKTMGPVMDRDMVIEAISRFDKQAGTAFITTTALQDGGGLYCQG